MSDFLSLSACNGYSPRSLYSERSISRPHLIASLLRDRHVPRYIVAPSGYGKSVLAHQYAETIFSFRNVYWLDCASPCFLRDLDAGIIAERLCFASDKELLVVFDALPFLDPGRADRFCEELDAILAQGGEVLVTCVPSCDVFAVQCDRMRLAPRDLLLSDDELVDVGVSALQLSHHAHLLPAAARVPGLVWGGADALAQFVRGTFKEDVPADLLSAMFVLLALHQGRLEDAAKLLHSAQASFSVIEKDYPHFSVDVGQGFFEAPLVSVEDLEAAVLPHMDSMVSVCEASTREALCGMLADTLLARGAGERACELMRRLPGSTGRAAWLDSRADALLEAGCILPASDLFACFSPEDRMVSARMQAQQAFRRLLLDDPSGAADLARRVLARNELAFADRCLAILVASTLDETLMQGDMGTFVGHLIRERGIKNIEGLWHGAVPEDGSDGGAYTMPAGQGEDALRFAAIEEIGHSSPVRALCLQLAWLKSDQTLLCLLSTAALLERMAQAGVLDEAMCDKAAADVPPSLSDVLEEIAACLCSPPRQAHNPRESQRAYLGEPSFARALAIAELFRIKGDLVLRMPGFDAPTLARARKAELSLYAQRTKAREQTQAANTSSEAPRSRQVPRTRSAKTAKLAKPWYPPLHVSLFGGLEASIGDARVDPVLFSRRKVRMLLALLVLNGGKEYARDRLASLIWPESNSLSARNNLYSIWSALRKALEAPSGGCPYLIRQQQGLRIDSTLLTSDVSQFEELCRTLLFESPSYGGWKQVYAQVKNHFSQDLLPSEDDNAHIDGLRNSFRGRLVDALVSASTRLSSAGEVREALWFGHAAVMRDRTREDAYRALMAAQLAAGQRTAALSTYFDCRRVLIDEMGIDPAPDTVKLYRHVIETEDELNF